MMEGTAFYNLYFKTRYLVEGTQEKDAYFGWRTRVNGFLQQQTFAGRGEKIKKANMIANIQIG